MTVAELNQLILDVLEGDCSGRCMDDDNDRKITAEILTAEILQCEDYLDRNYQS